MMEKQLYGREVLLSEWNGKGEVLNQAKHRPAFEFIQNKWQCQRCGTNDPQLLIPGPCTCGEDCFYCSQCLNMGKVKKCSQLFSLPEKNDFLIMKTSPLAWKGQLSTEQERASKDIIQAVEKKENRLVWAVAGAGKTEMIFEGIAKCLREGGRVCIASPRIDVCLELAPRIREAFPSIPLALLYGKTEEPYDYTPLVISTTHQLLRFKAAFDLLIIDEIDSFPYHNSAILQFASRKARKENGALLYLTATPPRDMQKLVKEEKLAATVLPARYHRFPLPEVRCVWVGNWRRDIKRRKQKANFLRLMEQTIQNDRRFLLFLPHIHLMEELEHWLKEYYPEKNFTSVSAEDPLRIEKVKKMREEVYDFILTTTILERGVTFRDIDVIVLGAEDAVFTEASLVQIAGRVGRNKDYPKGNVWFCHFGYTKAIKGACKQIKEMNREARKRGLLNEDMPSV